MRRPSHGLLYNSAIYAIYLGLHGPADRPVHKAEIYTAKPERRSIAGLDLSLASTAARCTDQHVHSTSLTLIESMRERVRPDGRPGDCFPQRAFHLPRWRKQASKVAATADRKPQTGERSWPVYLAYLVVCIGPA